MIIKSATHTIEITLEELRSMIGYLDESDRARFFRMWSKRAFLRRGTWAGIVIEGTITV